MNKETSPRAVVETLIAAGDLPGLLRRAAELHGHYCPGLASGVRAAWVAMTRLGRRESDGMERLMAEVECNNCFVDGVQVVTGCTIGNNALVCRDMGKTALTLYQRGQESGLRVAMRKRSRGGGLPEDERREAEDLFDRAVTKREELGEEEERRFRELWTKAAFALLEQPENDVLHVRDVDVRTTAYAPIHASVECRVCKEKVMETRARLRGGEPVCLSCADDLHWLIDGSGVHPSK